MKQEKPEIVIPSLIVSEKIVDDDWDVDSPKQQEKLPFVSKVSEAVKDDYDYEWD